MMAKLDTVSVSYQGKDYMIARIPDVFTNTRNNIFIGPHSLSHALYDNHIGYADEDARSIDEQIYAYVDDIYFGLSHHDFMHKIQCLLD